MARSNVRKLIALSLLLLLVPWSAFAAYLESDYKGPGKPAPDWIIVPPPPRPPIRPVPPWDPEDVCRAFLQEIRVGSPTRHGGMTVYPLFHSSPFSSGRYVGMETAWRRGDLVIEERGRGIVSEVVARNRSGQYILLLAGDLLVGGIQNRALRRDVLLAPYSGTVILPVYCAEQYRSSGPKMDFEPGLGLSSARIRRSVVEGSSQERVWNDIADAAESLGFRSPTGSHAGLYRQEALSREMGRAREAFRCIMVDQAVGAAFCIQGTIVGVDLFANPELFQEHWDRLLGSYWIDNKCPPGVYRRHPPWEGIPGRDAVYRFLRQAARGPFYTDPGPGAGQGLRLHGDPQGTALVHERRPIHILLH